MIPDLNLDGVGAVDLVDLLDGLKEVSRPLSRLRDARPCVGPSKLVAGCVDATEGLGTTVEVVLKWFESQQLRVFETLLETPEPNPVMADYRSYAIIGHMATSYEPLQSIAETALRLDREERTLWATANSKMSNRHRQSKRQQEQPATAKEGWL